MHNKKDILLKSKHSLINLSEYILPAISILAGISLDTNLPYKSNSSFIQGIHRVAYEVTIRHTNKKNFHKKTFLVSSHVYFVLAKAPAPRTWSATEVQKFGSCQPEGSHLVLKLKI